MTVIVIEVAVLLLVVIGLALLVYWVMTRNHPAAFPIRDIATERRLEELEKRVLEAEKGVMVDSVAGDRGNRSSRGDRKPGRDRGNHEHD